MTEYTGCFKQKQRGLEAPFVCLKLLLQYAQVSAAATAQVLHPDILYLSVYEPCT